MRFNRDRRGFVRMHVRGSAAVLSLGYLGTVYELEDLSHGGARLRGVQSLPPSSFEILLRVSDQYVEKRARVVWDDRDYGGSVGIEFEDVGVRSSQDFADPTEFAHYGCEAWASQQLERSALLVLDKESRQCPLLFQSLLALGLAPVIASTPLEAITMIERSASRIEAIFITPGLSSCTAIELSAFIAETYPEVRRILLDNGAPFDGLQSGAEKPLAKPWSLRSVRSALESLRDSPSLSALGCRPLGEALAVS